jgi:regulator of sigma E protease
MREALSAILWGIPTFTLLILLHEGGHFTMARAFGVKVHEFMLGLPGPALRFHGKQTTYGVTAIPLGGYVRIAGMEPGPQDELLAPALEFAIRVQEVQPVGLAHALDIDLARAEALLTTLEDWGAIDPHPDLEDTSVALQPVEEAPHAQDILAAARRHTYRGLKTWQRVSMLSAGVVMNLAAAVALFVFVLCVIGTPTPSLKLEAAAAGGPAATAGVTAGDTVKSIDGQPLPDWGALISTLQKHKPGQTVRLTVVHDGAEKTVAIVLAAGPGNTARLGIQASLVNVRESLPNAFKDSFTWIGMVFTAIGGFFRPSTFQATVAQSSSIVGASIEVSRAAAAGIQYYLIIVAVLSLSLGVINIVPIPPLDGGKIALELIERVVGRPLPRNVSLGLSVAGTLLLFALIGYLMYADILHYVVRGG